MNAGKICILSAIEQIEDKDGTLLKVQSAVKAWDGTCSADSVGYRLIRDFRLGVRNDLLERLFKPCKEAWKGFEEDAFDYEEPVWMMADSGRDDLMGSQRLRKIIIELMEKVPPQIERFSWGDENRLKMEHPLAKKFTWLKDFLNMPAVKLTGDFIVPRVLHTDQGACQRMVVSPGSEEEGIFHMPCGQSGNPISPHYRDAQSAWLEGRPTPFLPGSTVQTLILTPK